MFRCFLKYIENACQIFDIYQVSRTLKPPKTSKTDQDLKKKIVRYIHRLGVYRIVSHPIVGFSNRWLESWARDR